MHLVKVRVSSAELEGISKLLGLDRGDAVLTRHGSWPFVEEEA
jgi:hypothetical protein